VPENCRGKPANPEECGTRGTQNSWRIVAHQPLPPLKTRKSLWKRSSQSQPGTPLLIDIEKEPELPPIPLILPEIDRFLSSQPIFEDISDDEPDPENLPDPSILDTSNDDDTAPLAAAVKQLEVVLPTLQFFTI
jgi:hypothetical protein